MVCARILCDQTRSLSLANALMLTPAALLAPGNARQSLQNGFFSRCRHPCVVGRLPSNSVSCCSFFSRSFVRHLPISTYHRSTVYSQSVIQQGANVQRYPVYDRMDQLLLLWHDIIIIPSHLRFFLLLLRIYDTVENRSNAAGCLRPAI